MKRIFLLLCVISQSIWADEGMWQPYQFPELQSELKEKGLQLDPKKMSSFDEFPLNAIVSLGGCSASFVSPKGLVVTNHHCVYGSVVFNSTTNNNLLQNGFLAKQVSEEMPAAPGTRVYVTEAMTDVTSEILSGMVDSMSGLERYMLIEKNQKKLIKECEKTKIHRCGVSAFYNGVEYFLIKQLEIRDVRLVYAPATSVGKYGGDIDNWQWPRHTGDFGFYRAYVSPTGEPADFSHDNVPYQSKHFLEISKKGVAENDFVMAAGYPGSTNRYRTSSEIKHQFTWYYPKARQYREDLIAKIEEAAPVDSQARLSYEGTIASLANYAKNFQSMIESYNRSDYLVRRQKTELEFKQWLMTDEKRNNQFGSAVKELNALIQKNTTMAERDLWRSYFRYAVMPDVAIDLYRLAIEKQKPDAEREPGFQERDMIRFSQWLKRISRSYDSEVDKSILAYLIARHTEIESSERISGVDTIFGLESVQSSSGEGIDAKNQKSISKKIDKLYKKTTLDDEKIRLAWMDKSVEEFKKSKDPIIQLAVNLTEELMALEKEDKELSGQFKANRSKYMEAFVAYNRSIGKPIYSDANSSLRITYGSVKGNQPKDGLHNKPFTTLEGIAEKDTGIAPFDSPKKQLQLIRDKKYGKYFTKEASSVPVNFLSTLDITGGNSGSATLNAKGQLVGLLFDGVYESIIGDWDFDDEKNRAISVDSRYMLWVMEYLDGATNLIDEMSVAD
ncbi:MAG: S46 family peptidase [Cellvibrionaceae bacterium]